MLIFKVMDQILNKEPVLTFEGGRSKIFKTTFSEVKQMKNFLHIPELQADCNEDKIQEMKECYLKNPHFLSSKCLLTIAKIEIVDKVDYCLVDGQHRFYMILDLVEDGINDSMLISVITVKSEKEMKQLFEEINIDSSKCVYKNLNIFDKENYELLKMVIKNKIPDAPDKSNLRSNIYSISQFVAMLIDNNFVEKLREKNNKNYDIKELYKYLIQKESEFYNLCQYLELLHNNKSFKNDEKEQIIKKRCMFLKKNNFVEWLLDESLEPDHFFNLRPPITKKLRMEVWDKYFSNKAVGKCLVIGCNNILEKDKEYSWDCGHIISHFNNGPTEIKNLRPICLSCNKKMNYKNWDAYENELIRNIIIKDYFNKKDKITCKNESCKNKITKIDFYPVEEGDRLKPWCFDCVK